MEPNLPFQSLRTTTTNTRNAAGSSRLTSHRSQQASLLSSSSSSSLQRSGGAEQPTHTETALVTSPLINDNMDMDAQQCLKTQNDGEIDKNDDDVTKHEKDAIAANIEAENEKRAEASLALPPPLRIPGHLLRVLSCQSNAAMMNSQQGILVLIIHAAMLETGFVAKSEIETTAGTITRTPTPAAAMTDTASQEVSISVWDIPEEAYLPGMYRLCYCLRDAGNILKGEQRQDEDDGNGNWCSLTCSLIGNGVLFAARTSDGHSRHLLLNPSHYFRPFSSSYMRSGSLHGDEPQNNDEIETAEHQRSPVGTTPTQRALTSVQGDYLVVSSLSQGGGRDVMDPNALRCLWNALKDTITLPMLTAVCAAIGLPPPAGLLTLPGELKYRLIASLKALDLAALAAVNSELRHVASDDAFWRPLFDEEFPSPLSWVADQIHRRGYKWAFAMCWRERQLRRKEMEEARHRRRIVFPPVPHFPPAPFYPAPPPRGFPGIVGGDYDRLPFLGGTGLGGGGGRFGIVPGGGGMFGTGSARRQGHGGGGGGFFFF